MLLKISNLPSNLCPDWPSPVVSPSSPVVSLSLARSSAPLPLWQSSASIQHSAPLASLSRCQICRLPSFPSISLLYPSPLLRSPLPDVRRAGLAVCWPQPPASWRRGMGQMFGCIFMQSPSCQSEGSKQQPALRWRAERNSAANSGGSFWSYSVFVALSHYSSSSSTLSKFRITG